jgi:mannose-6-phosphate isomerase-like protein (cupin superfamily)
MTRLLLAALALVLASPLAQAQTAPASYLSDAEVLAMLKKAGETTPDMMVARMANTEKYRVNVVKRTVPQGAIAHDVGTEVHYIIEGTATLVTGGTIARPSGGGAAAAARATIQGGETRKVRKGDIVLVPVNTPHWYSTIDQPLTYLEVRFDVAGK